MSITNLQHCSYLRRFFHLDSRSDKVMKTVTISAFYRNGWLRQHHTAPTLHFEKKKIICSFSAPSPCPAERTSYIRSCKEEVRNILFVWFVQLYVLCYHLKRFIWLRKSMLTFDLSSCTHVSIVFCIVYWFHYVLLISNPPFLSDFWVVQSHFCFLNIQHSIVKKIAKGTFITVHDTLLNRDLTIL